MPKIAIIGPESTGKSTLTIDLAKYFEGFYVNEYARTFMESLGRPYGYDDVCQIAKVQLLEQLEMSLQPKDSFMFFDTDLIITKVWLEHCYQMIPSFVNDAINQRYFDLYLLCEPDIPWVADNVREHGDDRDYFFRWYKNEIEQLGTPFHIVSGKNDMRMQNAIIGIKSLFKI